VWQSRDLDPVRLPDARLAQRGAREGGDNSPGENAIGVEDRRRPVGRRETRPPTKPPRSATPGAVAPTMLVGELSSGSGVVFIGGAELDSTPHAG